MLRMLISIALNCDRPTGNFRRCSHCGVVAAEPGTPVRSSSPRSSAPPSDRLTAAFTRTSAAPAAGRRTGTGPASRRLYDSRYGAARPTVALVSSPLMLLPEDHPHAVRVLARAWNSRVIYRCWLDGVPYDPAKHGAAAALAKQTTEQIAA